MHINPRDCPHQLTSANIYWKWKDELMKKAWLQEIMEHEYELKRMVDDAYFPKWDYELGK